VRQDNRIKHASPARPFRASLRKHISAAGIYRTIEKFHPTFLIDEADTFFKDNEQLRGILNSGHSRTMAFVIRCEGIDFQPRTFSTWAAVAIAVIGRLPPTLHDRAIVLPMSRADRSMQRERWSNTAEKYFEILARKIVRWVDDHRLVLEQAEPEIPNALDDRAADNWRALLAIADLAGGDWPSRARDAALTLSMYRDREDQDHNTMLLADLRAIFKTVDRDRMRSIDICSRLADLEHRPWPEWRANRPITPPQRKVTS
jgi:putative DNA primase/helicase